MSVPVSLEQLRDAIADTDRAPYLLTVSDDGRPHCVAVAFSWRGEEVVCTVGARTFSNVRARHDVTLLWPPAQPQGYSLIVDASASSATIDGEDDTTVALLPTRAVLHRPTVRTLG